MKFKQKKGISLIVLVITIIVMIILASAIILSLNNSGIIGKANKAKEDTDLSTIREVASIAAAEYELEILDGTTTKTKKEYIEEYLDNQKLELPEGYGVGENGIIEELIIISEWDGTVATSFASGTGTEADPYIINTASEFAYLAYLCNNSTNATSGVYYKLNVDIDLKNISFECIGNVEGDSEQFEGFFDGDNHKIYNLYINSQNEYVALFVVKNATIKNIIIESGSVTGTSPIMCGVAAICGSNNTIQNCINKANISTQNYYAAGIAYSESGNNITIDNCKNYGQITAKYPYQISNVEYTNCQELGSVVTVTVE